MAKKVRRVRKKKRSGQSPGAPASPNTEAASAAAIPDEIAPPIERGTDNNKLTPEEKLREEYAYVILDLRRIAILAAAMFILLILLNVLL